MSDERNDKLINDIKRQLDESADSLDAITAARLQAARKTALQGNYTGRKWFIYFVPPVIASVFAVSVAVLLNIQSTRSVCVMEDLRILSSNEDINFYENIDFYQWLDEDQANG